jgi:hypothetical protein
MTTTLDHTPLDPATLGPEAQRALGSPATRMMAARGLAPIPSPRDLLAVLYQLALDPDDKLRQAAEASAAGLPEAIVRGGLSDPAQDPRVLDRFARPALAEGLLELVVQNPATDPATVARLAASGSERLCDLIADNQARLLGSPDIISALYGNRQARMSTVDRIVELAIRNGVKVTGIAAWDELVQAYSGRTGSGEIVEVDPATQDAAFRKAAALHSGQGDGDAVVDAAAEAAAAPDKKTEIWALSVPMKIRLAVLGNAFDRAILIRDPKKMVSIAAIKSPGVTEMEAAKYAINPGLAEDIIGYIANKREWTKLYNVKVALVNNPKCPLPAAMRLLPHLREKEIQAVSRSRGIPSALSTQARKLLMAKGK